MSNMRMFFVEEDKDLGTCAVAQSNLVTCFDVDDTLLYWDYSKSLVQMGMPSTREVTLNICGKQVKRHYIKEHIEELKRQKDSGAFIIVWSASGYEWAHATVKALELFGYVDLIMAKPIRIYDDKDPQDWMPKRRYFI